MKRGLGALAALVASALALSLGCSGAYALSDTVVRTASSNVSSDAAASGAAVDVSQASETVRQATANAASGAQTQELPDTVAESIPDDATIVSPDLAVTPSGEVKDVESGETVTDPAIVGTEDTPPDPLAKTDGKSYIPVKVEDAKAQGRTRTANAANTASYTGVPTAASALYMEGDSTVQTAAAGNAQGAYWGTYNNTPAFFQSNGVAFVQDAKWVVDVSNWNGTIDWDRAKAAGVQGAIIRIGYGWGNPIDKQAQRNISECKRLGIPFGVYLYSYAYDANFAAGEGESTVNLLRQAGVSPSDLGYSIYYDLEQWSWAGHTPPTDPAVYEQIARAWNQKLWDAGYRNTAFYSYTSYLNGPLNNAYVHGGVDWVAQYAGRITYTDFPNSYRGWQYTSSGYVDGIGTVDLNAFGTRPDGSGVETFELKGAIGSYRWYNDWLGNATSNEVQVQGGVKQSFQNGSVFWNATTGDTYAVKGGIRDEYESLNGANGPLGLPTSEEGALNGGASQSFQGGQIHWSLATGVSRFTRGAIQSYWASTGWENGWLGYPITDEEEVQGGVKQSFQNGSVFWNATTGDTYAVKGGIRDEYESLNGANGPLGLPTSEEGALNGGASQSFQGGQIHWSLATGVSRFTRGAIQSYWASTGWENGWLGYPITDEEEVQGGVKQSFQNGSVFWNSTTGEITTSRN
ncbi:Glycosyl hydrolase family 25 [Bifidobacterium sp. DSM 109958]|uniref:Glycosyl hydrolase family 25 n=1 Tax=Bifidobacterium moraviense TaxID=2675323 RepID=A0A7Y0HY21_9BIFI|nr:GH25 family lysozyme [Bifidobacterium sp. DSM 109958]NMN00831.1 Glycosyl hydrolase family 25 [Bifidobacterium sp. DSM 109958]